MDLSHEELSRVVEVAVMVVDDESQIVEVVGEVLQAELDADAKITVFEMYDRGEISEGVARVLLGDSDFATVIESVQGAEKMLSGDSSRFVKEGK